ncbi:hypothetical protein N7527_009171 [Penicillium freii]|nr:hypothetical protein N7527_009171 [Penicillium freii]
MNLFHKRKEKDKKLDDVEVDQISDTEEQDDGISSRDMIDIGSDDDTTVPSCVRTSGRKRKHVDDEEYEYH